MKRVIFSIDFLSHNHTFWLPHIQAHANMSSRRVTENPWSMIGWIPWISYRHDITHFCNRYNYNCQKSISMFISKVWMVSFYKFAECNIFKVCINLLRIIQNDYEIMFIEYPSVASYIQDRFIQVKENIFAWIILCFAWFTL